MRLIYSTYRFDILNAHFSIRSLHEIFEYIMETWFSSQNAIHGHC